MPGAHAIAVLYGVGTGTEHPRHRKIFREVTERGRKVEAEALPAE
jgi:hypothetical protein